MNNTTQNKLADAFAKRFEEYNTKVLEELAKVIKRFNGLTYTEASKLANELKYDKSYIDIVDELSKLTGKTKKEIKKILEETINQHIEFADTFFKAREMNTPVYQNDKYLTELVNSVAKVSEGDFVNLAKSTGFAFLDKKNHIQFLDMKETYYKVIDECVYAISEGKATFQESMRDITKQLVDSGVRRIVYVNDGKKQYTQRLDSAVRRNVLDSIREVSIESQKEFGKRFRADGVEVTVHENPAPDHENVQGHQFSTKRPSENELSEWEKFQNDEDCVDVNGIEYPATSEETGHDRRSIGQYNCYHTVFSIILGVSKPLYSNEELKEIKERANEKINIDGKNYTRYEVTQMQRSIETEIRKAKDSQIMHQIEGDREAMLDDQQRIKQLTRKYREISQKAGLREQLKQRTTVSGYKPAKISYKNFNKEKMTIKESEEYYKNIGEKYFDTPSNEYLEQYINYQHDARRMASETPEKEKKYLNIVENMRKLERPAKLNFVGYRSHEVGSDFGEAISFTLSEDVAKGYKLTSSGKGRKYEIINIMVEEDTPIISIYNAKTYNRLTNEPMKDHYQFGKQAEIIAIKEDVDIIEDGNTYYIRKKRKGK